MIISGEKTKKGDDPDQEVERDQDRPSIKTREKGIIDPNPENGLDIIIKKALVLVKNPWTEIEGIIEEEEKEIIRTNLKYIRTSDIGANIE